MSRGLGWVALKLRNILVSGSVRVFTTNELCQLVYRVNRAEKKHRVAVLRALRTLVDRNEVPVWRFIPRYERADAGWFNPNRVGKPRHSAPLTGKAGRSPNVERSKRG
jgi:hypothetical protein